MRMDKMPVYVAVTQDKYELPLAVADTIWELARLVGVTDGAICKGVDKAVKGKKSKYRRVWIDLTPEEAEEQRLTVWAAKRRAGLC